jgi:hypothetical protein
VDLTLIRWFMSLTPMERLATLENHRKAVQQIRDANPQLRNNAKGDYCR